MPKTTDGTAIRLTLDTPSDRASIGGAFTVAGWALDGDAWSGTGVGAIHVWALPRDGSTPVFLGAAALGGLRPDVAEAFGAQFDRSGWTLSAAGLSSGKYGIVAYVWSLTSGRFEDARGVRVTVR